MYSKPFKEGLYKVRVSASLSALTRKLFLYFMSTHKPFG